MDETTTPTPQGTPVIETPIANEQPGATTTTPEQAPNPAPVATPKPEETPEYWKERYGASSREFQILQQQLNEKEQRLQQLTTPQNPTDEELRRDYPDWDTMLPHERKMATDNVALRRSLEQTRAETMSLAAERKWEKDFTQATKSFPALKGKEDEFQSFALKPSHKGVDVTVLAQAFLYGSPPPPAAPTPPAPPTGERSTGTPPTAKSGKISLEDARTLRVSDYQAYLEQVKAGNIEDEF